MNSKLSPDALLQHVTNCLGSGDPSLLSSPESLRDMIASCHQQMLLVADQNTATAAGLALAGVELLEMLTREDSEQPDWLPVLEEQFYRYGAIWMDALLSDGRPDAQDMRLRALEFLGRLRAFHDPVPTWIEMLQAKLEQQISPASLSTNLDVVVVGNCQAHPLMLGLRQALPELNLHFCPSVHLASVDDVHTLHGRLASADLLITHRVTPGYRDGIGLDTATLRGLLPPTGRTFVLPNLHYEGCHPWIGYAHPPAGTSLHSASESPLGPYHDFLVMVAVAHGLDPSLLQRPEVSEPVLTRLRQRHAQSLEQLRQREAECDVPLSDWLQDNLASHPLFHTINHPTQSALDQLLRRLLRQLGLSHQLGPEVYDRNEYLGSLSIPIHPWVIQALALGCWAHGWGQRDGMPLPFGQQLEESWAFYRDNPRWIASNRSHSRYLEAEVVLMALAEKHLGQGGLLRSTQNISAFSPDEMRIALVGSEQLQDLQLILEDFLPRSHFYLFRTDITRNQDDLDRLHRRLRNTDLLITNIYFGYHRDAVQLDRAALLNSLSASSVFLVVPRLHDLGQYPWIIGHPNCGLKLDSPDQLPLGGYHDLLVMVALSRGIDLQALSAQPASPGLIRLIQDHHLTRLDELSCQEQECDVKISDWLKLNLRQNAELSNPDSPTRSTMIQLALRVLEKVGIAVNSDIDESAHALNSVASSLPIHPWVMQALSLGPWADGLDDQRETTLAIGNYLADLGDYYRNHPACIDACRQSPSWSLAEQALDLMQSEEGVIASSRRPTVAALISYYDDEDMLDWQLKSGCLEEYDRIYIWDGPYAYSRNFSFFPADHGRLDRTELGRRLLNDSRVVYLYRIWEDEAEKRSNAYSEIREDLVVLHDADEFFELSRQRIQNFWCSPYAVGSLAIQNLYAGGVLGTYSPHPVARLEDLPLRRMLFKRELIDAVRHLDFLWLVGVQQQADDIALVDPGPYGSIYHLTCCRSKRGQAAKMSFYMSLPVNQKDQHPIVSTLVEMVRQKAISAEDAHQIFLQGDPGYAGVPNPSFGLRLQARLYGDGFDQVTLRQILADSVCMEAGSYPLLEGYPLQLWSPSQPSPCILRLSLETSVKMHILCWCWAEGELAARDFEIMIEGSSCQLHLEPAPGLIGRLLTVTLQPVVGQPVAAHSLLVERIA